MTTKVKLIAAGVITPSELTLTTASAGTNTVTPATTAFVQQELTSGLAPKATIASPTFTGTPSAPTAAGNTTTTQLATTAFVQQEITTLIGGAPSTLNDLNELAAAINDDANYNSTLTTALATKLPLAGGAMTGNLTFNKESPNITLSDTSTSRTLAMFVDDNNSVVRASGPLLLQVGSQSAITIDASRNTTLAGTLASRDITITGQSSGVEGGQINLLGVGSIEDIHVDNYNGTFRIFDGSAPQVRLSLDTSGHATFAGSVTAPQLAITSASTADTVTLTRGTNGQNNMLKFVTGSTADWIVGERNDSTSDFRFYSYGTSSDVLSISRANGNVNIGSSLMVGSTTAPSATLDIRGTNTYNKIVSYFSGSYISGFQFSDLNGGIWYDAGTDDLTVSAGHANSKLILASGGSTALTFLSDQSATFSGTVTSTGLVLNGGRTAEGVTAAGTYAELTRASGGDLGLLFNKDSSKWLIGIDNSDGNAANLRFMYGAYNASAHPGFGSDYSGLNLTYQGRVGVGTRYPGAELEVAGTALVENAKLKAITESNSDTAVDVFVYDTRKDSDGGAWRKRTQNTSWYNETLNTSTRGARKEFPSVAVIVAENDQVTIYDADDPDMTMWMVFNASGANGAAMLGRSSETTTSIEMLNGILCVGRTSFGLHIVHFISDLAVFKEAGYDTPYALPIGSNRNSGNSWVTVNRGNDLVNDAVYDVAMTVLPNAPIDAETGLPVPTIAVATNGGVSVIKDNGSVFDITTNVIQHETPMHVKFVGDRIFWLGQNNYDNGWSSAFTAKIPNGDAQVNYNTGANSFSKYSSFEWSVHLTNGSAISIPIAMATPRTSSFIEVGTNNELILGGKGSDDHGTVVKVVENLSDPEDGMIAQIASDFNTGYQVGDIQLAALSDTSTTNVTSPELITNGTTFSNTTGWTGHSATVSVSGGELVVTGTGSFAQNQSASFTAITGLTPGDQLIVSFDITGFTAVQSSAGIIVGGATIRKNGNLGYWYPNSIGTHTTVVDVTSTGFTLYLHAGTGVGVITKFDNISVHKLHEVDRSYNRNNLQAFGTVPKTAVATGADLVAYGPFTSSNYLQQHYNSDLDFGTGDFMYSMWIYRNSLPTSTHERWFGTAATSTDERIDIFSNHNTDNIAFYSNDGGVNKGDVRITGIGINLWHCLHFTRQGNVHKIYHNGELKGTTLGSSTLANYQGASGNRRTHIGAAEHWDAGHAVLDGKIALAKISGTVPTPEQIKKIYDDEKALFQENAKATLYGASNAVTALAYDDDTELLHVGTSAGRSEFQGLRRVNNTTDAVGTTISASDGFIVED